MAEMDGLNSFSHRRIRLAISPHDSFFEEGNVVCLQGPKLVTKELDELAETFSQASVMVFNCPEKGCGKTFPNTKAYDFHYNAFHKYRCKTCRANFPSDFLLDLHIQENHDPLFQAEVERGLRHYRCICDGCVILFQDKNTRNKHVIEEHNYPSDFRFNKLSQKSPGNKKMETDLNSKEILSDSASKVKNHECNGSMQGISKQRGKEDSVKKQKMPKTVCFGRGSERAFSRSQVRTRKGKDKT